MARDDRERRRSILALREPPLETGVEPDVAFEIGRDLETFQRRSFSEEIARDNARRLRAQELAPARPAAPRRRPQLRLGEQPAAAMSLSSPSPASCS
jgi:hypothetical protein